MVLPERVTAPSFDIYFIYQKMCVFLVIWFIVLVAHKKAKMGKKSSLSFPLFLFLLRCSLCSERKKNKVYFLETKRKKGKQKRKREGCYSSPPFLSSGVNLFENAV